MPFLAAQCRAARSLLEWSQADLATASGVAAKALADFERGSRGLPVQPLALLRKSLEDGGVLFLQESDNGGAGVCLVKERSVKAHAETIKFLDDEHAGMAKGLSHKRALNRMKAAIAKDDYKKTKLKT